MIAGFFAMVIVWNFPHLTVTLVGADIESRVGTTWSCLMTLSDKIHNGNQGCRPRQCCYLKRKQANTRHSELAGLLNRLGFGRFDVEKAHKTMLAAYQNKNIALSAWLDGHMVLQAESELLNGTHKGVWIFRLFLFLWTVAALRSCPNNSCPNY